MEGLCLHRMGERLSLFPPASPSSLTLTPTASPLASFPLCTRPVPPHVSARPLGPQEGASLSAGRPARPPGGQERGGGVTGSKLESGAPCSKHQGDGWCFILWCCQWAPGPCAGKLAFAPAGLGPNHRAECPVTDCPGEAHRFWLEATCSPGQGPVSCRWLAAPMRPSLDLRVWSLRFLPAQKLSAGVSLLQKTRTQAA